MREHREIPSCSVGILAGGKSTRMGQNKALLKLNNETMLERLLRQLYREPDEAKERGYDFILSVSSTGEYGYLSDKWDIKYAPDETRDIGPIEGIYRILKASDEEYVFVCAADMPFVTRKLADYMAQFISSDHDCYVLCDDERIHPLCAIYSRKIIPVIEELIRDGKYRIRDLLYMTRTLYIDLSLSPFDKKTVRNINTREEYESIKLPVIFAVSGYHDSGKTYLIEKLINEFINAGYRVSVIKHDGCGHISEWNDTANTDTERVMRAGAESAAVFSDNGWIFAARGSVTAEDLMDRLSGQDPPPDVIILEGFKTSEYPKVYVFSDEKSIGEREQKKPGNLICAVYKDSMVFKDSIPEKSRCPVYERDDVSGIFLCLCRFFGIETEKEDRI
ncbi:MAG: molybdopterin-guanine dinucleotide biosynthesis protein B [Lachnospiraceae bacterium]|nr:molybdopterin-guanine dinucleotide biosynthesis protein B [Lachnospiraceae bacterium]